MTFSTDERPRRAGHDSATDVAAERVLLSRPSALPAAFDAPPDSLKVLVLVSPTCTVCLEGVQLVRESFAELGSAHIATHIVWLPVLPDDTFDAAQDAAKLFRDVGRVAHYWDVDLQLSRSYREVLQLERWGRSVAWDLYLLYDAAARWSAEPPIPSVWMQQLRLDGVPTLDRSLLVGHLRRMLGEPEV